MAFDDMDRGRLPGSEEVEANVEFRPTLVIGLGGSGHEVLVRLKARFTETYGAETFKIVKLLAFDTAEENVTVTNSLGHAISLNKETELVNIGHVPVSSIWKNLDINPTIKAWLPEKLPVRAITAGAQQIRPLGRLALYYHFNREAAIKSRLLSIIRELGNIKLRGTLGEGAAIARSRGINIFIICSVCGGTGSGTFLDMAYLVKSLIEYSGIRQEFCFVNGILVLPQAFATVASDAIMANAYAALRELEYFSKEGNYFARYPDGTEVNIHNRPFNICYLVDAVNERGKLLTGMEDLAPMIAESIFIQIGSQVGQATKSVFDNVKSLDRMARSRDGDEKPTVFSSLGTASLIFPARQIINMCAYRFGQEFISQGLLRQPEAKQIEEQAKQFVGKMKLIPKELMTELARDARGNVITVHLDKVWFEAIGDEQLGAELRRILAQYDNQKLNTEFKKAVDVNRQKAGEQIKKALVEEIARLVNTPDYGPRYAKAFLERLKTDQLTRMMAAFAEQRTKVTTAMNQGQKDREALFQQLLDTIKSFPVGRHGRVVKARDEYLQVMETKSQNDFDVQRFNAALSLLADLNVAVDEQVKEVSSLVDKLEQVQERFERNAREMMDRVKNPAFALSSYVTDDRDVNQYYDQYKRGVPEELVRFLADRDLYQKRNQLAAEIATEIFAFVSEPFEPVSREKIEKTIESKRQSYPVERRLEDLREDSVPFWNYDPVRLQEGGDLDSILVIGVEDRSRSIYTDKIRRGETLSSTRDPHQVVILHTRHGLPIFALQQIETYRAKYEDHLKRAISPLHLYPSLPWLQDMGRGKQQFALGQAFEIIHKTGVWYYRKPKDDMLDEIRLDQGLEAALKQFLNDPQGIADVAEMVEKLITRMGNEAAAKIIYRYTQQPRASGPQSSIELELQKAARAFMEEMGYSLERIGNIVKSEEAEQRLRDAGKSGPG